MEDGIGGDEGEAFALRLGDEHTIEGVGMVRGQVTDGERVPELHGKSAKAVLQEHRNRVLRGDRERQPAGAQLDGYLPCAHDADCGACPVNCGSRSLAQPPAIFEPPDQGVCIQKQT